MTHSRFIPVQLGLCLLALGCTSEAPRHVQITCTETPTYSSRWGSEPQGSLSFGTTVKVQGVSFSDRLHMLEALGSGTGRYLSESCVAPYPLKGEPRWIQTATVSVEQSIGTAPQQAGSTKSLGDAVEALTLTHETWGRPGSIALIHEGAFLGFVPAQAVGEKPPPVERYAEQLAAFLTRSEFPQAELLARGAFDHFPKEARLQRLLGALAAFNGSQPPTTSGALPELAPLPDLPVVPLLTSSEEEEASDEGPRVYSAAVGLRIRQEPRASAKALALLNVNQPLELRSIDEDWAEVIAYPGHRVEVSDGEVEFVDQPPVTGYAALRFLSRTPLEPGLLLAQGKEALSAGRPEEATVLLHRALAAAASLGQAPSTEAHAALVQASFASGRFESLFQWLTSLKQKTPPPSEVESPSYPLLILGCHGKLAKARVYDLSDRYGTWAGPEAAEPMMKEPHACIGGIDLREPMEPQSFCIEGICEPPSELIDAQSTYSRVLRPMYRKWSERVAARFDSSAYLYFRPHELTERPDGKRLLFYSIPLEGGSSDPDTFSATLFKDRASVTELTFPRASDWRQLEVWVSLPDYLDYEYGLVLADSQTQVEEWLKQRENQFDYQSFRIPDGKIYDEKLREAPFTVIRLPSLPSRDYEHWWRMTAVAEEQ
ncbi:hypothetical protein BO221_40310 [Archangium sp. Cb G35]|uniref:hypothetical protein n=1 Tax=Archangium sp. Cb G35 TaxID=1920190 RepID=UPI000937D3A3|nr:hypothetical protein [Archangium sp. Cb G35]OJT18334.1 hypothetical protein BO221_40310 [Archangium sp. Cb G35]